jgi:hypothetical protein
MNALAIISALNMRPGSRVYISGPMTGMPELNAPAFNAAEQQLAAAGYEPVNPVNNGQPNDAPWHQHMRADIAMLVTCEAIVMLPGWQASRGATLERHIARRLGMLAIDPGEEASADA